MSSITFSKSLQILEQSYSPLIMSMSGHTGKFLILCLCCILGAFLAYICTLYDKQRAEEARTTRTTTVTWPMTVAKDLLTRLPVGVVVEEGEGGGGMGECPICLDEFQNGDVYRSPPNCGHVFHVVCVDQWFLRQIVSTPATAAVLITCPVCRRDAAAPVGGGN
ncbi:NEP1-interacting protein 1 [Linum grandiflorum]